MCREKEVRALLGVIKPNGKTILIRRQKSKDWQGKKPVGGGE